MPLSLRVPARPLVLFRSTVMKADNVDVIFFRAGQCMHNVVASVAALDGPSNLLFNKKPSGCLLLQAVQMHTLQFRCDPAEGWVNQGGVKYIRILVASLAD